jgi:hypothetical protein
MSVAVGWLVGWLVGGWLVGAHDREAADVWRWWELEVEGGVLVSGEVVGWLVGGCLVGYLLMLVIRRCLQRFVRGLLGG